MPTQPMSMAEGRGATADFREFQQSLDRSRRISPSAAVRGEFARHRRARLSDLKASEVQSVLQYLQNPVRCGLWTLRLEWKDYAGVSEFVWRSLENRFSAGDEVDIQAGKFTRRFKLTDESKRQFYQRVCGRLSFVFELFTCLVRMENPPLEMTEPGEDLDLSGEDQIILQILDLHAVKNHFKAALEFFKQHIYHADFEPTLSGLSICRPKGGFMLLPSYFAFFRLAFPHIIKSDRLAPQFQKAFTEYENSEFANCVESLGLVAEDYLVQIYETIFRDACPKRVRLAQINDRINGLVRQRVQTTAAASPGSSPAIQWVSELLERVSPEATPESIKESLLSLREAVGLLREERRPARPVTTPEREPRGPNIFPPNVADNLDELIGYCNDAADKYRVPIDSHEALRTMFCLITLILWWEAELQRIDWKRDADTILKGVVQRSSGSPV
ncbi:MAG: hypothetical protein HY300_07585 [Verrucomicrobia bacterium]|nr:hypothetical protein [Verrucomicrobiota bacterium]